MAEENSTQKFIGVDEAATYLEACSQTFGQLASILKILEKELPEYGDLRKLAGAGVYLASDFENAAGCWQESLQGTV